MWALHAQFSTYMPVRPCLWDPSLLTVCTRSREKIWMQQMMAERVQMMAAQTVSPQTLKRRFC